MAEVLMLDENEKELLKTKDNLSKAGKAMIKKCKDTPFENRVHSILDLGEGFLEIEDLFSKEDKVKFGIEKNGEIQKKAHSAIYLKTFASLNDFGEETKTNFINFYLVNQLIIYLFQMKQI